MKSVTLNLTQKEAEYLMQRMNDDCNRLPPESKETPNCTGCHPQIEGRQGTHQMGTVEHPWIEPCRICLDGQIRDKKSCPRCEGDGVEPKIGTWDAAKGAG